MVCMLVFGYEFLGSNKVGALFFNNYFSPNLIIHPLSSFYLLFKLGLEFVRSNYTH